MQDFRTMMNGGGVGSGGGGGRIFGGERRLRPFPNQALKCPRCDSLNTKFCYYNNYNLSQPRHFCKSCRRYWTKGGVLRNVPVGGGCRKTKRSKPKTTITTTTTSSIEKEKKSTATSHSSSDSSSLTATTTTEAASSNPSAAAATATLMNFPDSSTENPNSNILFEQSLDQVETGGGFTSLMNASSTNPSPFLGFNYSPFIRLNHHENQEQEEQHILQQQQEQQEQQQQKMVEDQLKFQELTKGLYGETVDHHHQTVVPVVDMHGLTNGMTTNNGGGGLTVLDWQQQQHQSSSNIDTGGILLHDDHHHHQGLFDLLPNSSSTTVVVDDHQSYWSQTSHWTENDHSLYLP